jgi:ubiquinone/menaquinone biosynthesis C-methylase UbiE
MTTDQAAPTSEGTSAFYDVSNQILIEVWDDNFHHGYWLSEDDDSSNREATDRMTDLLLEKAQLDGVKRILDVGCGIGTSAFRMAGVSTAEIVGVSNNTPQIDEAKRRAEAKGLTDRVSFEYADVLSMPFPDESFDFVWVVETLMHMDRLTALREIRRVLKPGGRVVVSDQLQSGPMTPEEKTEVTEFMTMIEASPLLEADAYKAVVAESGFDLEELTDVTKNTKKTSHRVIDAVNERWDELLERYGDDIAPMLEMFRSPIGLVPANGYCIAVLRKPA